jgi:subtilisin family serine protease
MAIDRLIVVVGLGTAVWGAATASGGAPRASVSARQLCMASKKIPSAVCLDPEWGAKQMRIRDAWRLMIERQSSRDTLPGTPVSVGQIDTGYTLHPAITRSLDLSRAQNFLEKGECALDKFSKGILHFLTFGLLTNPANRDPGHGTKTASILVGIPPAAGRAEDGWVLGVAPGVRLVPVRGTKGPALGSVGQVQAAKSICYLAGGVEHPQYYYLLDRSRPVKFCIRQDDPAAKDSTSPRLDERVQAISISRGGIGPPDKSLRDALDFARDSGVIVVAASGDYENLNLYPADACSVISVAGSTIEALPWRGSPKGRPPFNCDDDTGLKIDIAGPGEFVWRAETRKKGSLYTYSFFPGRGTSFAAPAVAGVAALWLEYRAIEIEQTYVQDLIPFAFRYVLHHGGARLPAAVCAEARERQAEWEYSASQVETFCKGGDYEWKPQLYGAGILDAVGVLQARLPTRDELCEELRSKKWTPPPSCGRPS